MKALITAGNDRLGKKITDFLTNRGYQVITSYHTKENKQAYKQIQVDFSSYSGVQKFYEKILEEDKDIDLLVNNYGPLLKQPLLDTTYAQIQDQFFKIAFIPFILMQKLAPYIQKKKGSIINIGFSGLNHRKVSSYYPIYKEAKALLFQFTKSFAKAYAEKSVRVNMISPGYLEDSIDLPEYLSPQKYISHEQVLQALDFFIDPKNSAITGQNIEVSSGLSL
jgi:NAD(P)-dependent dehydrogenase (short-subunit alcohol dehydrogenase family)